MKGVSARKEDSNPHEIEQQHNIEQNKQVLHQLGIVCLTTQIKGAQKGEQVANETIVERELKTMRAKN